MGSPCGSTNVCYAFFSHEGNRCSLCQGVLGWGGIEIHVRRVAKALLGCCEDLAMVGNVCINLAPEGSYSLKEPWWQ